MKAADLREKSVSELSDELIGLRLEQFNLRVQQATGQLSQTHLVTLARKDIARVKTVLSQKTGN